MRNKLKVKEIEAAKPGPKVKKLIDGAGLQLWVMPTGAKYWRYSYRFAGKQKLLALGVWPALGLAEARDARDKAAAILREGNDPSAVRKVQRAHAVAAVDATFAAIGRELVEKKRKEGKAPATIAKLEWLLSLVEQPLGDRPIAEIRPIEILGALKVIEGREQFHSARRLRSTLSEVFRLAISTCRAETDPTSALKGALATPPSTPRAAITRPERFGELLRAIDGYGGGPEVRIALQVLALTFVRNMELRYAVWAELDLDKGLWTIPAARMKMDREHRVPLAPQTIALLRQLRAMRLGRSDLLFPGQRGNDRPISENTLNAALRRLGFPKDEMCAHGFRSAASTMLNESRLFHPDAIERQLAHVEQNAVRRAYDRSDHLDERVRMMAWWADRCDQMRASTVEIKAA